MRRAVLRRSTLGEPEVANLCPPVKAARGSVVLVGVIERAIVNWVYGDIAVIAPAIARGALAACAVKKMLFT